MRLRGVGPKRAAELAAAGFETVADLLFRLPRRYEDRRCTTSVGAVQLAAGRTSVTGHLRGLRRRPTRRRGLTIVEGQITDDGSSLDCIWFNRPYLVGQVRAEERYVLHGELVTQNGRWQLRNAELELEQAARLGVVPIYAPLGTLSAQQVRRLVEQAVAGVTTLGNDDLTTTRDRWACGRGLPGLTQSWRAVHQPPADADLEEWQSGRSRYHKRIAYERLIQLQREVQALRGRVRRAPKPQRYRSDDALRQTLASVLPFALTGAQKRVLRSIAADLGERTPMMRLLQGDVGSGKTIVAALAILVAAESGVQSVLMAPTETLAQQHRESLQSLFGGLAEVVLVSAGTRDQGGLDALATGEAAIAVGTHSLFQRRVEFARLGLVVIDEQHRFGVEQRAQLFAKGELPDLLVMSATPIPRSLTLALHGDLDLSQIDELPPGRRPVTTRLAPAARREDAVGYLRQTLERGEQAFVVFPQIRSEDETVPSLEQTGAWYQRSLLPHTVQQLSAEASSDERQRCFSAFQRGEISCLLATSIVEVGIDVPNATLMIIEGAERFGLAQLHQFRGRVGRGTRRGVCLGLHGELQELARRRLDAFHATTDGFAIAELDLRLRGPGDLSGTRQAGRSDLDELLLANVELVEWAHEDVRAALHGVGNDNASVGIG